ncbi:MAG: glycine cleavage system aminomethyltransferase GcvT [Dehalococcoidia bacterium]|nr:glycine cleavage system aminomethyltransferase GcvT [Dehalococcoidia bacterium]
MADALLQTPLHAEHVRLGGRMVPFAGWEMPIQFGGGILAEARAVRSDAGLFDVSHMARLRVSGGDARALLDWTHTADIGEAMPVGRARYGLFCNERGGIIDDGIVYRLGEEEFLAVANAANAAKVRAWLERRRNERFPGVSVEDLTAQVAMIALQGPHAMEMLAAATGSAEPPRPFRVAEMRVGGAAAWVARTGYTGEDGVEIMPRAEDAAALWRSFAEAGAEACGLGARDVLRLEAGLLLHGSDMDESVNPVEAGLERFVNLGSDFCGAEVVRRAAEEGAERRLTGFKTRQRGAVPRPHSPLVAGGERVGEVTSGGYSPTLDTTIGLGYLPARFGAPGAPIQVDVRGKVIEAETVPLPFYTRSRSG